MKKLTPEDRERLRRVDDEGRAARENMRRVLDEVADRRLEWEQRGRDGFWRRLLGRPRAA
jgi:hypothetical protein